MTTANDRKQLLLKIAKAATQAMAPDVAVKQAIKIEQDNIVLGKTEIPLGRLGRLKVLAIGKAALGMAQGAHEVLSVIIADTLVITHEVPPKKLPYKVIQAAHPLPDERSQAAAAAVLNFVKGSGPDDVLLVLLSGGSSSLLCAPVSGVDLKSKAKMTDLLLRSGAAIPEINVVRKHLSSIKGGYLLSAVQPAQLVTLAISDVPGDSPEVIGSGLVTCDTSTFAQALQIIEKYDLVADTPKTVMHHLRLGAEGKIPETPKPQLLVRAAPFYIIRQPRDLINAAARACESMGIVTALPFALLQTPVEDVARRYAAWVHQARSRLIQRPIIMIAGGEPSVKVASKVKAEGGRCQHLALLMAKYLEDDKGASFLALATDGADCMEEVAGAYVTEQTAKKAAKDKKLVIDKVAEKYQSYLFHSAMGTLLPGKPTGTNVGDLHLLCLEPG